MSRTVHQDDPTIADEERLFRRIHLVQLVKDDDTGLARVSSGAFRDRELSVNLESVLQAEGKGPRACLENHVTHKLVSLSAGVARRHEQAVCRDSLPDDLSHGLILGSKNSRRVHEGLRDSAIWIIPVEAPLYVDILQEKREQGIPD